EGQVRPDSGAPPRGKGQHHLQGTARRSLDVEERQTGIPQVVDGNMEVERRLLRRFRAQLAVPGAGQLSQLAQNTPAAAERERQLGGPVPRAGQGVPPVQFDTPFGPRGFGHIALVLYSESRRRTPLPAPTRTNGAGRTPSG